MLDLFKELPELPCKTKGSTPANATPSVAPQASTSHTHADSGFNLDPFASPIADSHQIGVQSERKKRCIDWGITALEGLKSISEATGVLLPLNAICDVTLAILKTIKAIDGNKEAWKEVLEALHKHHAVFKRQLDSRDPEQMERDLDPKLLNAIQAYARNLDEILGAVMSEHGISQQTLPNETRLRRLVMFIKDYGTAKMDGDRITGFLKRLDEAMKQFNTSIGLYTAIQVDSMGRNVQFIKAALSTMNLGSSHHPINHSASIRLEPRPALVKNFIGRKDVLESMERTHLSVGSSEVRIQAITVLYGLGGSGKTQTALKFALKFEESCPGTPVYFLDASSEASIQSGLENIIRSRGTAYTSKDYRDALAWLATNNWLIIMDKADDPELGIFQLMPQCGHGNIIITTRNFFLTSFARNSCHHLEGLSAPDSATLLLNISGNQDTARNRELAGEIAQELGDLPLAVAQAGGYIFTHKCLPRYLQIYREGNLAAMQSALPYDYPTSVETTIQMSLQRLPAGAQDLMRLFSHLDSKSIAHDIVSKSAERQFRRVERTEVPDVRAPTLEFANVLLEIVCPSGRWSEADFNALITHCLQSSLLRVTPHGDSKLYSMHILIRSYLRALSSPVRGHQPSSLAVRLLGSASTFSSDSKDIEFNLLLLPHLRQIRMEDVVEAGDHFVFGHVMRTAGDNKSTVRHLDRCIEMWRGSLGDEHENTLSAMVHLSISHNQMGRFPYALELRKWVWDVRKAKLGTEHRDTLVAALMLSESYGAVGKYKEAARLGKMVFKTQKRVLGLIDADTVMTMAHLASHYEKLGQNQEGLKLREQITEIRKRKLGPDDPGTLYAMSSLVESYLNVGRKKEALKLSQQVLVMQKRVLGDEHLATLRSIRIRLRILHGLRETKTLRDLLRVALPAHEKVLGVDHRDTLWLRKTFRT